MKPYLIHTLLDQLPILENLLRYLEELTILQTPQDLTLVKRGLGVEEIPEIMNSITQGIDLKQLAEAQKTILLSTDAHFKQQMSQSLASMYHSDHLDVLLDDPKCADCGSAATQRCSRCKNEWYCSRPCQVKSWKTHKGVCDVLSNFVQ